MYVFKTEDATTQILLDYVERDLNTAETDVGDINLASFSWSEKPGGIVFGITNT